MSSWGKVQLSNSSIKCYRWKLFNWC